jgi:hypothetical protein
MIDPVSLQLIDISAAEYWQHPFDALASWKAMVS